jgi:hypothetical protein
MNIPKIFFIFFFSIMYSGCAVPINYDLHAVAQFAGNLNNLGKPIKSATCSYIQARIGETEGARRRGLCIAFESSFVFREIEDKNKPYEGNSIVFHYSIIDGAGVTLPDTFGTKDLIISTKISSNAFVFPRTDRLGIDSEMPFRYLEIFKAKKIRELKEPKALKDRHVEPTIIFNNYQKKK